MPQLIEKGHVVRPEAGIARVYDEVLITIMRQGQQQDIALRLGESEP